MNQEEHLGMARLLMGRADEEYRNGGNGMIAAEFMWGAFAHCLITVALNRNLPHDSHGAFRIAAQYLDTAQGGNKWRSCFGSAEQLHFHFYHGDLSVGELQTHWQNTDRGTRELLAML